MPEASKNVEPVAQPDGLFATTHWSVVLAAGQVESPQAQAALETLCCNYWYPLYAYVRRKGYSPEDAQDLTQEFFARFLARNDMAKASPAKGRFRSYLLGALNHFLSDARDHQQRQKRGGNRPMIAIDLKIGEGRYQREPSHDLSPDRLYERRWALLLLEQVLNRLGQEYAADGKTRQFQQLKEFLTGDKNSASYAGVARALQMSESALRVAIHRLRRRYGELFRLEVAHTVCSPEKVEEEMRYLLTVLSG